MPDPLKSSDLGPLRRSHSYPSLGRLRQFGYRNYRDYLRSSHWLTIRSSYRQSDRPQDCYCCGDGLTDLHHKTYERLGAEHLDDLVPLCRRCHSLVHVLERRGDLTLDLAQLLDAQRARLYHQAQAKREQQAQAEFTSAHSLEHMPLADRVGLLVLRAEDGEQEASRALFVIRQRVERWERHQSREARAA